MSNDITNVNLDVLGGVPVEEYTAASAPSKFRRPAPRGEYNILRDINAELKFGVFGPSENPTALYSANAAFRIADGEYAGKFAKAFISTQVREKRRSSSADDFLKLAGHNYTPANGSQYTLAEYKEAIEQTVGPVPAFADWEGYCKECNKTVFKTADDFPVQADGTRAHVRVCPNNETHGEVGAKLSVRYFLTSSLAAKA